MSDDTGYGDLGAYGGGDGQAIGGLAVHCNLGWNGAEKYVALVPRIIDLWARPQER